MQRIELTLGRYALVDDEDFDRLSLHSWAYNPQGVGYAVRKGNCNKGEPRTVQMHREILHAPDDCQIDHINGNGLDNRKENLRYANVQKNAFNRKKPDVPCSSKYKGVYRRRKNSKWNARIKFNDKHIELGTYVSEEYAAAVYNFAARVFFGEYRRENTGNDIPEINDEMQTLIFEKCNRAVIKHGWYVDTETYRSFLLHEVA